MHRQNLVLIACRLCALLFAGVAMAATAIGAWVLYRAVFGLPELQMQAPQRAEVP